jgi:ABC-type Mn2+/Zn2+ transport system ATPase subunit
MNKGLDIRDLTVSFNRIPAVHHLSAHLEPGCCVGIIGPNGAGKTTLLKAIAGLLPLETGTVDTGNQTIAYVPQREAVDWDFPITVRALAEMGRYAVLGPWRCFTDADQRVVDDALKVTELEALAGRQIKALSGGQQQRAFLARALAQEAGVYLLDEPFTGLDTNARRTFAMALGRLRDRGKLVLASHHDLASVPELFDKVLILNGELVACGPTEEVFNNTSLEAAFSTPVFAGLAQ